MPKNVPPDTPPSFEKAMEELEAIVEELEAGELTLDQSLERYERGIKAVKDCRKVLDEAEHKLKILVSDEEGNFGEDDFAQEPE